MSEDTPRRPLFLISKSRQDALERAEMMKHTLGHGKSDVTSERGPIVPIYPDYESDLPFVNYSRAVPTSDGTDVPTTRDLRPIAPKPTAGIPFLEFEDVAKGAVREAAARLTKLSVERADNERKDLAVGEHVLYGEDGPMPTPPIKTPTNVTYFARGMTRLDLRPYLDQTDMTDPWIDIPKSRPVIDAEDMKELHQLMGYNCDPASAHEQKLYMTFGVATIPFRK